LKKFKKPLDIFHKMWYNKDVPREGDAETPNGYQQAPEKKSSEMEKPLENPLTFSTKCGRI